MSVPVYETPHQDEILAFSSNGGKLGHWGSAGSSAGQFYNPTAIATDLCSLRLVRGP